MKTFMIAYFEKCLDNKVNEYTLNWIRNNSHRLPEENSSHIWQDYINHFAEKRFKSFWHDIIPFNAIYEIYIEIGFSESSAKKLALRVRNLMETPNSSWYHDPSVYAWLPRLLPYTRRETYQIADYCLTN